MAAARRGGVGAYTGDWKYTLASGTSNVEQVLESLVDWCKETLGETRRPCGINEFDLVIAVGNDVEEPQTLSLRYLVPSELYTPGETLDALRRLLHTCSDGSVRRISVALFSWGDAAHAALARDGATA